MAALFTSPNPHFFKIILHHTLSQGKIDLPMKFVKNNGDSLLYNKATLSLPDGSKWEVEVQKSDGKFWFVTGWSEFMEFYSVQAGYFVVFRLEGNCCFNVLIFDTGSTEIGYPMKPPTVFHRHRQPVLVPKSEYEDEDEDEEFVQIQNAAVLMKRRREKEKEVAYSSLLREMRENSKFRFTTPRRFDDEEDEEEEEPLDMNYSGRQRNYRGRSAYDYGDEGRWSPETMRPTHPPRTPQPLTENQERVLRRASLYKLKMKNPSFMVTMRPSYIHTGNYLSLPRSFAERYLKESVDVKLELADGRNWSVWCGVRWAVTRRRTELKGGWKRFAVDNQLQEGDVCVFELIHKTAKVYFEVTIFRLRTY